MNIIYNDDCFNIFSTIADKSINLVCVDLPYGQTMCGWDTVIDLNKMWIELKRIGKDNCQYVFFCTTKFGNELINSNPKWFRYDIVWQKQNIVGFLTANKMPLRQHEMIYVFGGIGEDDIQISRNLEMRQYADKVYKYINKKPKEVTDIIGSTRFYRFKTSQFGLPTKKTYTKLIEQFKLDKMEGFIKFEDLKTFEKIDVVYNPQKIEGKAYKAKLNGICSIYNTKRIAIDNKGDRHPTSILNFGYDKEKLHPTQKPVQLCEWIINTYSNEGDIVLDFTMGSGSTIIACMNTKRNYIGIEKDEDIFKVAKNRIDTHKINNAIEEITL
jgi:DNA modification methylase